MFTLLVFPICIDYNFIGQKEVYSALHKNARVKLRIMIVIFLKLYDY